MTMNNDGINYQKMRNLGILLGARDNAQGIYVECAQKNK